MADDKLTDVSKEPRFFEDMEVTPVHGRDMGNFCNRTENRADKSLGDEPMGMD
jgi:hypothetical protein